MKRRSWFWGITFLLSAAFIIALNVTGFDEITIPGIITTILSIALVVESIVHRHLAILPIPFGALYYVYQVPFNFPYIDIKFIILAVICLSLAIFFLTPRHKKPSIHVEADGFAYTSDGSTNEDNYVQAATEFGNVTKYLHGEAISGGDLKCNFGNLTIYFDQAHLAPGGATIQVACSFGQTIVYVPSNWPVKNLVSTALGSSEVKGKSPSASSGMPVLTLNGHVSFGDFEIRYI
jgi:predicted membrane protein